MLIEHVFHEIILPSRLERAKLAIMGLFSGVSQNMPAEISLAKVLQAKRARL